MIGGVLMTWHFSNKIQEQAPIDKVSVPPNKGDVKGPLTLPDLDNSSPIITQINLDSSNPVFSQTDPDSSNQIITQINPDSSNQITTQINPDNSNPIIIQINPIITPMKIGRGNLTLFQVIQTKRPGLEAWQII